MHLGTFINLCVYKTYWTLEFYRTSVFSKQGLKAEDKSVLMILKR